MYISGFVPLEGLSQGTYSVFQMLAVVQLLMYNLNLKMRESDRQNSEHSALAGVAQWIQCQSVNQGAVGLIPSQGTCLGCRPGPQ